MQPIKVMYTVLAYVSSEFDATRSWAGESKAEADKKLLEFVERWPLATVRVTEERYYSAKK